MLSNEELKLLVMEVATATPIKRLNHVETAQTLRWLHDSGHMTFTGKRIDPPLPPRRIRANNPDGSPIYE